MLMQRELRALPQPSATGAWIDPSHMLLHLCPRAGHPMNATPSSPLVPCREGFGLQEVNHWTEGLCLSQCQDTGLKMLSQTLRFMHPKEDGCVFYPNSSTTTLSTSQCCWSQFSCMISREQPCHCWAQHTPVPKVLLSPASVPQSVMRLTETGNLPPPPSQPP